MKALSLYRETEFWHKPECNSSELNPEKAGSGANGTAAVERKPGGGSEMEFLCVQSFGFVVKYMLGHASANA
jgi:hypothetical protein